ncbi:hypothetical protein [Hymenobacter cheonanensis]|uniref:hypothetical protein n=1 Tax=Hymenobacter sp. CA2-7 TaxID=3063993 RepID=UPI00271252AB|nr:hypothetical protein [Hymenobacter sp. CA2-7]MDO7888052.1 hypothetical protein [Hymenobacter sp. CA2-7]
MPEENQKKILGRFLLLLLLLGISWQFTMIWREFRADLKKLSKVSGVPGSIEVKYSRTNPPLTYLRFSLIGSKDTFAIRSPDCDDKLSVLADKLRYSKQAMVYYDNSFFSQTTAGCRKAFQVETEQEIIYPIEELRKSASTGLIWGALFIFVMAMSFLGFYLQGHRANS